MYKVKKAFEGTNVYVNGKTKLLKDCDAKDIAVLVKNGHEDWFEKSSDAVASGEAAETKAEVVRGATKKAEKVQE